MDHNYLISYPVLKCSGARDPYTALSESDIIQPTLSSLVLIFNAGSLLLNFPEASRIIDIVIHNAPQAETSSVVINT